MLTSNGKEVIGYTNGVFDLFHIGHLNIFKQASLMCDKLIVGVITDEEVVRTKKIRPVIQFEDRIEIVRSCRYVDVVVAVSNDDKTKEWDKYRYDRIFVGNDHFGSDVWVDNERYLKPNGVEFFYFPYTKTISTTEIVQKIQEQGRQEV